MTSIDDFAKTVSAGFKVITTESGRLSEGLHDIVDRDDILASIAPSITSLRRGDKRDLLISGPPGSGRSHLLRFLARTINRIEHRYVLYVPFSECDRFADFKDKKQKFDESNGNIWHPEIRKDGYPDEEPIPEIKRTGRSGEEYSVEHYVLVIDDIDLMLLSWNTNNRFLSFISDIDDRACWSIIATTSSIPPPLLKMAKWDDTITVDLFSRQSIARIIKNLVQKNISKDIVVDDATVDYCALFSVKNFKSSMSSAVAIMERAAGIVERALTTGERTERSIMMKDIDHAATSMRTLSPNPAIAGSKVLVMAMMFVMKRATIENLHVRVKRVAKLVYPDRDPPSIYTVRNVLNNMVSSGIVRKVRSSDGRATGVKTTWICDMPVGQIETAMPGEVMSVMKLIVNGAKRREQ